jgi:hypothetical protein
VATKAGNKRANKAAKRKQKLTKRSAKRSLRSEAHHWDTLFGEGIRYAVTQMAGRTEDDIVAFFARGRLLNGVRVLKAFIEAAGLNERDEAAVRTWAALQPSLYECLENRGTVLVVRDLMTWQTHTVKVVHAAAAEAFERVEFGALILLPTPDGPVMGGEVRGVLDGITRQQAYRVAANLCRSYPRICQRGNLAILDKMLLEEDVAFRQHFGAPFVLVAAGQLNNAMAEFAQTLTEIEIGGFIGCTSFMLDDNADEVGLIHHEAYGFALVPSLRSFLDGVRAENALTVEAWLKDGTVTPAVFDIAHSMHPAQLTAALSKALGGTAGWPQRRDALIEEHKPRFKRPIPHLYPMPVPVSKCFDPNLPPDGIGMNALLGLEM